VLRKGFYCGITSRAEQWQLKNQTKTAIGLALSVSF
jgi:hypothetical protein